MVRTMSEQRPCLPCWLADPEFFRGAVHRIGEAVVCAWVVSRLQRTRPRVTRLAAQKVTYLLEHAMLLGIFAEHDRKPLGPYDSKSRYRDAEPIARKKGWLSVEGTALRARDDLADLTQFVPRYVRNEAVAARFVDKLGELSDDQIFRVAPLSDEPGESLLTG
jgi:hypothetical protein